MDPIIDKSEMSEEDVKLNFITPALKRAGWGGSITMETKVFLKEQVQFTDGQIDVASEPPKRKSPKKADYVLYLGKERPIAVVEAKDNGKPHSHGLQQAIEYALALDVPFAYSSNGDAFRERDLLTGQERDVPLDEFPTPDQLRERFEKETNGGEGLTPEERRIVDQPYYYGEKSPRYYQRVAIDRTVRAVARGRRRLLLVMATGTGKTYVAFQIVWRLIKSGLVNKVLYLADRNVLVDQSIRNDFRPLEKVVHKIALAKEKPESATSYQVYFSLYQQLATGDDAESDDDATLEKLKALFKPDFFDLVIVDECHRGSAKKDSSWRKILEYFEPAIQLGMTATPKETADVSNIDYFGEPIYKYSLREGIIDGFLAPFRVVRPISNVDYPGFRPYKGQVDKEGELIEDRVYNNRDYDKTLVLEELTKTRARTITEYLKRTDRMARTIVFCVDEEHALRMRDALVEANQDMVAKYPDYVVRITSSDVYGKSKLDAFISVDEPTPVIATTSKLLSTGADCKMVKLIVIDQIIESMTEFKQTIGRGTRINEGAGKTYFAIMDFRDATHQFADPDWDGPVEQDEEFDPDAPSNAKKKPEGDDGTEGGENEKRPRKKQFVGADGCKVYITREMVSYYDAEGNLQRTLDVVDYAKESVRGVCATLESFIAKWSAEEKKSAIRALFAEYGVDLDVLKEIKKMENVDDFDFICHIAYGRAPLTRRERAEGVRKRNFFDQYEGVAREILEALLDRYADLGVDEIESASLLKYDPFDKYGSISKIFEYFGGKERYFDAVKRLERAIYEAAL